MAFSQSMRQLEALLLLAEGDGLITFIEEGIRSLRQGQWKESFALFTLARTHCETTNFALIDLLNAFLTSLERSWQAQQALHEASKRFVEAEAEQELRLQALQHMLQSLLNKPEGSQQAEAVPVTVQEGPLEASSPVVAGSRADKQELALTITCFGCFTVKRGQHLVNLGTNRNGQIILRYLVTQPEYSASKDVLMGLIWPDQPEEIARRRLQVAISAIRCALNEGHLQDAGGGYIIYQEPCYLLNPVISVYTDAREFITLWKMGQQAEEAHRITYFERACALYTAPFMADDLFADWTYLQREEFNRLYLTMCHILAAYYLRTGVYALAEQKCKAILKDNHCDELAHCQLMRIYALQGARSEAIRQYQQCAYLLEKELGVSPLPETQRLFQTIATGTILPEEGAPKDSK